MNHSNRLSTLARVSVPFLLALSLAACQSKILKVDNANEILRTDDFDNQIKVAELPAANAGQGTYLKLPGPSPISEEAAATPPPKKLTKAQERALKRKALQEERKEKRRIAKLEREAKRLGMKMPEKDREALVHAKAEKAQAVEEIKEAETGKLPAATAEQTSLVHEPSLEDPEGFLGRRPEKDPFRVGEKITLEASYFGVVAGEMTLEVRPFVQVNGRKSYNFAGTAISTSVFAMFYAVNDWFETYVDYEKLRPYSYALHVKESKQLREARSIFNWDTSTASFLDKKVNSEKKVEEKKQEWSLPAYSQNIFSIAYYIRAFQLKPGKRIAIRLAHENENLVVTTEILRRERLSTEAGEFNTIVAKPKIEINGVFKPVGDIFIWFTDDDRKFIVRMESKIKIGTIVAAVKSIERGQP